MLEVIHVNCRLHLFEGRVVVKREIRGAGGWQADLQEIAGNLAAGK